MPRLLITIWSGDGRCFNDCNHMVIDNGKVFRVFHDGTIIEHHEDDDLQASDRQFLRTCQEYVKDGIWTSKLIPEPQAWKPVNNKRRRRFASWPGPDYE